MGDVVTMAHSLNVCMIVLNDFTRDTRVLRAATALSDAGYAVTVIAAHTRGLSRCEFVGNVRVIRVHLYTRTLLEKTSIRFVQALEFALQSLYWIAKIRPFVCHCHDISTLPTGYVAKNLFGSYFIYDSHELQSQKAGVETYSPWFRRFHRFLEHFLIQRADHVIVVGRYIAEYLAKQDRIPVPTVIRNIADIVHTNSVHHRVPHFGFSANHKVVIYQGELCAGRGLCLLVQSLQFLDEHIVLVFVGDGPFREMIYKEAERANVLQRIYFQGWVSPVMLLDYIRQADLGIVPIENVSLSYFFSLPNKLFECVAAGLPVIGSNFPEIQEIIKTYEVGTTFDPSSPKDIARAINHVVEDPLRYRNFCMCSRKASLELTWNKEKEKLVALYRDLFDRAYAV